MQQANMNEFKLIIGGQLCSGEQGMNWKLLTLLQA